MSGSQKIAVDFARIASGPETEKWGIDMNSDGIFEKDESFTVKKGDSQARMAAGKDFIKKYSGVFACSNAWQPRFMTDQAIQKQESIRKILFAELDQNIADLKQQTRLTPGRQRLLDSMVGIRKIVPQINITRYEGSHPAIAVYAYSSNTIQTDGREPSTLFEFSVYLHEFEHAFYIEKVMPWYSPSQSYWVPCPEGPHEVKADNDIITKRSFNESNYKPYTYTLIHPTRGTSQAITLISDNKKITDWAIANSSGEASLPSEAIESNVLTETRAYEFQAEYILYKLEKSGEFSAQDVQDLQSEDRKLQEAARQKIKTIFINNTRSFHQGKEVDYFCFVLAYLGQGPDLTRASAFDGDGYPYAGSQGLADFVLWSHQLLGLAGYDNKTSFRESLKNNMHD